MLLGFGLPLISMRAQNQMCVIAQVVRVLILCVCSVFGKRIFLSHSKSNPYRIQLQSHEGECVHNASVRVKGSLWEPI